MEQKTLALRKAADMSAPMVCTCTDGRADCPGCKRILDSIRECYLLGHYQACQILGRVLADLHL